MAANGRGDIGLTGDVLGGDYYNVFYVIPIDEYTGYYSGYTVYPAAFGDSGPSDDKWGNSVKG